MPELTELDVAALYRQVLWAGFALACLFGAVAQRSHFCTLGALADIVNMGDWTRMRMWVMAMGLAALGFNAMVWLGWLEAGKSIYAAPQLLWASNLLGGLLFGIGMVLASGCGSKTLVRLGAGNLKSLVVFLVMGLAAFATMKGVTAVLRVETVDRLALALNTGQDLPSLLAARLGLDGRQLALACGLLLGGAALVWSLWRAEAREGQVLLGGLGSGTLVLAFWWVSGRLGHVAEDPSTLQELFVGSNGQQRMEGLSFVAPVANTLDWLLFYSDKSKLLSLGIVSTLGVASGSMLVALATRKFRWEGFRNVDDLANHLVGALLMGVGGVVAMGCTIGQGLSGISTLSLGSFLALAGIMAGAVLALRWQAWRLERLA
jgi:uncharacterized membrane protein YedE/YeeE